METIEDRIIEYETNCKEGYRGELSSKCKLTREEMIELIDLAQSAVWYRNGLLSNELKAIFLSKISSVKTKLPTSELIERLGNLSKE